MRRLYDELVLYSKEDYYPMHMPGHKRNTDLISMENPYSIDITEIDGFDNLHQAEGVLRDLSIRISRLYHSLASYPLVNGSTVGILAAMAAATNKGDKILLSRNSHKSVYHGAIIRELNPIYIYPQQVEETPVYGGILPCQIEEMLIKYPDIKLVIITSPTYEGVVSDIGEIARIVHQYNALLLVDEAHGAHFGFHEYFPKSAVSQGADLVIQSFHKTLPAFTQTAVLHSNCAELNYKIEQYLAIYESSSPSYLLMAGIDQCIHLLEQNADQLFKRYVKRLDEFYQAMLQLKKLQLINREIIEHDGNFLFDPSKLTISVVGTTISGSQLKDKLREDYHIEMEMDARDYVLGMTSICDTEDGFRRLQEALLHIDSEIDTLERMDWERNNLNTIQVLTPSQAFEQNVMSVKLSESIGRISGAFIGLYPPGSSILVPGERIDENILHYIEDAIKAGLTITGLGGNAHDEIAVIC